MDSNRRALILHQNVRHCYVTCCRNCVVSHGFDYRQKTQENVVSIFFRQILPHHNKLLLSVSLYRKLESLYVAMYSSISKLFLHSFVGHCMPPYRNLSYLFWAELINQLYYEQSNSNNICAYYLHS